MCNKISPRIFVEIFFLGFTKGLDFTKGFDFTKGLDFTKGFDFCRVIYRVFQAS